MTDFLTIASGSVRWTVQPAWRDRLLGPEGLRLDDWLRQGQARIVKHGPHRTVYRVDLGGEAIYLKHNRPWNLRAWLRELIRPAKSRIEFEQARAIAARGIDTIEPIAVGEAIGATPAASFLLTRELHAARPLSQFLLEELPTFAAARRNRLRQSVALTLADFIRRLHDQGIEHHDLHPGNLLVRLEAGDRLRYFLVDLHATRLGPPLSQRARTANLVVFNNWFALQASRSDRLRFYRRYAQAGEPDAATQLERLSLAAQQRFWTARAPRCLGSNRYFQKLRRPGLRGHAVRDLDPGLLDRLLADPDGQFTAKGAVVLKDSRGATVAELPGGLIWKRFRPRAWRGGWLALLRPTQAMRSWRAGHALLDRGLPTARPLLVLQRHGGSAYLLTEKIAPARTLHQCAAESQRGQRCLIDRLAWLIRELHRRGLVHRDLKASNILVDAELRPWLIDLVGCQAQRRVGRAQRVQNLARLNASFLHQAAITRADRLRFLRIYLQLGLKGWAGWKRWWRQVESATQAKAERNRKLGRVLG